jgi:hypothetical protein
LLQHININDIYNEESPKITVKSANDFKMLMNEIFSELVLFSAKVESENFLNLSTNNLNIDFG